MTKRKYFKKGEGDYYYRRKDWALKAQRAAKRQGKLATLHGSRGHWEVRVRLK